MMSTARKALLSAGFALVLVLLAATDALLTAEQFRYPALPPESAEGAVTDPAIDVPPAVGGVQKRREPEVFDVLAGRGIASEEARDESLLRRLVPPTVAVVQRALLRDSDRLALFSYVASPDAKSYYLALKEALIASFSPDVRDLIDETKTPADGSVYNALSFTDPAISSERILFVRVRERLYEFQFPPEQAAEIQAIVGDLTK